MSKHRSVFLAFCILAFPLACGPANESGGGGDPARPLVVATTGMIADSAARIAGPAAEVRALMGPGVDPHLYKASERDVRLLTGADVILYNGLHLEGKMGEILERLEATRPVVAVAGSLPSSELMEPEGAAGQVDPHVWFDVRLWSRTLDPIVEVLSGVLPEERQGLADRAEAYRAELGELDAWVESRIAEIPPERRVLVTAHDAFGYFGRRYGMTLVGLQGISTLSEAGLRDVDRVVKTVVVRRIPAIFVESSVPRRSIEAVRAACRAQDHEVRIGGELFSDAMGAPGTPEGTYPGMVRHNVETIVSALRGDDVGTE
jgi:manganese/zinc/iron transport system substrate-binding protein